LRFCTSEAELRGGAKDRWWEGVGGRISTEFDDSIATLSGVQELAVQRCCPTNGHPFPEIPLARLPRRPRSDSHIVRIRKAMSAFSGFCEQPDEPDPKYKNWTSQTRSTKIGRAGRPMAHERFKSPAKRPLHRFSAIDHLKSAASTVISCESNTDRGGMTTNTLHCLEQYCPAIMVDRIHDWAGKPLHCRLRRI
jgi:hypothetical protein